MTRKPSKKAPISVTPGIDWHDEKQPTARNKKKNKPTPTQRLATMSDLTAYLAKADEPATLADIELLQTVARAQDIDIASLEI
ncbi:hypothetical protein [Ferribacterium limneticum]|uniref:hypothetical protein n=1 Tax=Ferribacterium limneticum TaxID=76259 RepID=UPI001CF8BA18|nr:hypothetical protein [Ferribacterium limneticum]UCV22539.1 hypothetical protein KI613_18830 [Ferribacterium limneticum]